MRHYSCFDSAKLTVKKKWLKLPHPLCPLKGEWKTIKGIFMNFSPVLAGDNIMNSYTEIPVLEYICRGTQRFTESKNAKHNCQTSRLLHLYSHIILWSTSRQHHVNPASNFFQDIKNTVTYVGVTWCWQEVIVMLSNNNIANYIAIIKI